MQQFRAMRGKYKCNPNAPPTLTDVISNHVGLRFQYLYATPIDNHNVSHLKHYSPLCASALLLGTQHQRQNLQLELSKINRDLSELLLLPSMPVRGEKPIHLRQK